METKLKVLRVKHKYTQADVAQKIGISDRGYSNYERGLREPPVSVAIKLARIFKTTVENLFA